MCRVPYTTELAAVFEGPPSVSGTGYPRGTPLAIPTDQELGNGVRVGKAWGKRVGAARAGAAPGAGKTALGAFGAPGPAAVAAAGHHGLTGHPGGAAAMREMDQYSRPIIPIAAAVPTGVSLSGGYAQYHSTHPPALPARAHQHHGEACHKPLKISFSTLDADFAS